MDLTSLFSLEGRTALVTGGSRGIGRMIAHGLLAAGARVYISSRKNDACEATASDLARVGPCFSLPADVSTLAGIDDTVARLAALEPRLDILVNNAGAAWAASLETFPESGWDKVMDLNVKSPFFLAQRLLPLLTADRDQRPPAKIINIASIDGLSVNPGPTYSYQASKAALLHLTHRQAVELAPRGVVVSSIAPGAFASSMNKDARDRAEDVIHGVPAGRIGVPEDMAAAAVYLASRAGDYVVGSTLVVDGGATLVRG